MKEKIENLNLRFLEADVSFKLKEGINIPGNKEFEIKLQIPNHTLFAKSHIDTKKKAIPLATKKMKKQLIKYKSNLSPKRK
ncbi:MAG: HPF/RaiA family ribosome-associated protein [Saprospiraceae bacterium]